MPFFAIKAKQGKCLLEISEPLTVLTFCYTLTAAVGLLLAMLKLLKLIKLKLELDVRKRLYDSNSRSVSRPAGALTIQMQTVDLASRSFSSALVLPFIITVCFLVVAMFFLALSSFFLLSEEIQFSEITTLMLTTLVPGQQTGIVAITVYSGWFVLYFMALSEDQRLPLWRKNSFIFGHVLTSAVVLIYSFGLSLTVFWKNSIPPDTYRILFHILFYLNQLFFTTIQLKVFVSLMRFWWKFYRRPEQSDSTLARALRGAWTVHLLLCIIMLIFQTLDIVAFATKNTTCYMIEGYFGVVFIIFGYLVCLSSLADELEADSFSPTILYFPLNLVVAPCLPSEEALLFGSDLDDVSVDSSFNHTSDHLPLLPATSSSTSRTSSLQSYTTTPEW